MSKPMLTVLAGMPGAGKSHWCESNTGDALLLSADRLRRGHASPRALFGGMYRDASLALLEGRDVIIDACSLQCADRAPWIAIAGRCRANTRLAIIDTPASLCAARDRVRVHPAGRHSLFRARFRVMIREIPREDWGTVVYIGSRARAR